MQKIFLTSSVSFVAKELVKRYKIKGKLAFITTASELKSEGNLSWQDKDRDSLKKSVLKYLIIQSLVKKKEI